MASCKRFQSSGLDQDFPAAWTRAGYRLNGEGTPSPCYRQDSACSADSFLVTLRYGENMEGSQRLLFGLRSSGSRPQVSGFHPQSSDRGVHEVLADLDGLGDKINKLLPGSHPNIIATISRHHRDLLIKELQVLDPQHELVCDWLARM
jgi:hypothetical protein